MNHKKCPKCGHCLEIEIIALVKNLFEIEVWGCHNCRNQIPKRIIKDIYEDIPSREFKKEKEFAIEMAQKFLVKQKVKIRFVEKLITATLLGETRLWRLTNEVIDICFPRKTLQNWEKFVETLPHELAHASDEVRLNSRHNPYSLEFANECPRCGVPHPGEGHDKIWHDKWDELTKKVKKELKSKN